MHTALRRTNTDLKLVRVMFQSRVTCLPEDHILTVNLSTIKIEFSMLVHFKADIITISSKSYFYHYITVKLLYWQN